jgi:hypothetical protein
VLVQAQRVEPENENGSRMSIPTSFLGMGVSFSTATNVDFLGKSSASGEMSTNIAGQREEPFPPSSLNSKSDSWRNIFLDGSGTHSNF